MVLPDPRGTPFYLTKSSNFCRRAPQRPVNIFHRTAQLALTARKSFAATTGSNPTPPSPPPTASITLRNKSWSLIRRNEYRRIPDKSNHVNGTGKAYFLHQTGRPDVDCLLDLKERNLISTSIQITNSTHFRIDLPQIIPSSPAALRTHPDHRIILIPGDGGRGSRGEGGTPGRPDERGRRSFYNPESSILTRRPIDLFVFGYVELDNEESLHAKQAKQISPQLYATGPFRSGRGHSLIVALRLKFRHTRAPRLGIGEQLNLLINTYEMAASARRGGGARIRRFGKGRRARASLITGRAVAEFKSWQRTGFGWLKGRRWYVFSPLPPLLSEESSFWGRLFIYGETGHV
ncbi:hypothetical protein GWI33_012709 [Rhynchophorus ferrugineus]|uniref:Uncharacterized protein n=1 Tax=Rhynchophorus ferrugineus TaxID=354439 RepID=A0A834I8G3_RHYFE|nr:hypothetical protein GWI33_012709 [Rhynchophorus ferrugineus]